MVWGVRKGLCVCVYVWYGKCVRELCVFTCGMGRAKKVGVLVGVVRNSGVVVKGVLV